MRRNILLWLADLVIVDIFASYLPHPFVDPHRAADLLVGDGDALGLEELLEGEHGREHARVHHRSWNSGGNDYRMVN